MRQENYICKIALNACEKAAIASNALVGKYDENAADQAAVFAMRTALNSYDINARIVIGEGERDKAPMLYIGEKLGKGGELNLDIAVDPLEGTTLCAHNLPNSMSIIAIAESGNILNAPDLYMNKIAVGANLPKDIIDLDLEIEQNLKNLAQAKKCSLKDLNIVVLKRSRHLELIKKISQTGAKISLIQDGDVAAVIATCFDETKVDMYVGIGGAPEGVLAACALKTFKGQMQTKLLFYNEEDEKRAKKMGIKDLNKKYNIDDMVRSDVVFVATAITDQNFIKNLKGIKKTNNYYIAKSLLASSFSNVIKFTKNKIMY